MKKKEILFVDDEPNILSGIKRMLRSMRHEFGFHFSGSAREALDLMEKHTIDVVISDMRMPGMDGAELLTEVMRRYPYAIRIMLTGQADEESVIRTVNVVHQFLAKPCAPDQLKEVLIRSSALHDLMTNRYLKEIISGIGALPSLPSIYLELQNLLKQPDASANEIAEIIEKDIAMTAKLLQLVNSAFFGLFQKVESLPRAVKLLGYDTIKTLVLSVKIFSELKTDSQIISFDYLQEHSMMVAQCSKKIAADISDDPEFINNCFITGVLHDIGRILLLTKMHEKYLPLVNNAKDHKTSLWQLELEHFNATHGDIGAYLIGLWGFTGDIIEAVAFHNSIASYPGDSFSIALAIHIADAFYYKFKPEQSIGDPPALDMEYITRIGLDEKIEFWSEVCQTIIES